MSNEMHGVEHSTTYDIQYYNFKMDQWKLWVSDLKNADAAIKELIRIINHEKKTPYSTFSQCDFRVTKKETKVSSTTFVL